MNVVFNTFENLFNQFKIASTWTKIPFTTSLLETRTFYWATRLNEIVQLKMPSNTLVPQLRQGDDVNQDRLGKAKTTYNSDITQYFSK